MHSNYYIERGEGLPHLPICWDTGEILLATKKATTLHQDGKVIVLRLNPEFARLVSA